jgi:hypothetical protein
MRRGALMVWSIAMLQAGAYALCVFGGLDVAADMTHAYYALSLCAVLSIAPPLQHHCHGRVTVADCRELIVSLPFLTLGAGRPADAPPIPPPEALTDHW